MTESEFKYWAFLSYSPQDNCEQRPNTPDERSLCWGNWLHEILDDFSVPADLTGHLNARGEIVPEHIGPIFRSDQELPADGDLGATLRDALDQSRCLIVICSPRSAKNLQVNEAVRYFKQLGRGNRILPIVIAGEPNVGDGLKPGVPPESECFVPAMRHPVKPDGTLDTSRRERGYIFADARHGNAKQEILAKDLRAADTELETAKIQLIAGLIGVGFNGLWRREQRRRFAGFTEAQHQVREAQKQANEAQRLFEEARIQAHTAESKVLEAQDLARVTQSQLEEARNQVREAQNKVLEIQNLPQDVQSQIQEAQNQALAAQDQARDAQSQLQTIQNQARETERQLADARNQARTAEDKVEAAQNQARDAQRQLEEARQQAREAQNKVLAVERLPQEVKGQIQEAQSKVLEAQNQAREAQGQAEEARSQAREAKGKVEAAENQARETRKQLGEAQNQVAEARDQVRAAQNQVQEIQNQTRDAQNKIQHARSEAHEAQAKFREAEDKARLTRRLTRVFALMAALALLAAGTAAGLALWQRKVASQAQAKATAEEAGKFELASDKIDQEQIQQTLHIIGGAEQDGNRLRSLDEIATRIPAEQISDALKASADIVDDRKRSHFQKQLLLRLAGTNRQSALASAGAITGTIVNDAGTSDTPLYFQLAILDDWIKTDSQAALSWVGQLPDTNFQQHALARIIPELATENATNTLARLNDFKPLPGEQVYSLLFQSWAATDPVQAITQREQVPGHDDDGHILSAIMLAWMGKQPDAALSWLKSQPDSESLPEGTWRNTLIAGLIGSWATNDLEAATAACRQLPDGVAKEKAWERVLNRRIVVNPASAAGQVTNLPPGDYRASAVKALCGQWADTDTPSALAWAQSLPVESERTVAVNVVVGCWAGKAPLAASQVASQHPELSTDVFGKIADAWSQQDLTGATNWIGSLPDGTNKEAALLGISESWAQNDPKGMATYALGLPAGKVQAQYLTAACRQLAVHDFAGTVELLKPLSDGALRRSILEQLGHNCDVRQLAETGKYIAAMPADDNQNAIIQGLLPAWMAADPETAASWLYSFPTNNLQTERIHTVIKAWAPSQPAAVSNWLANLPTGTASDEMIDAFLEGTAGKYPEFAAQWTQSVADDARRQKYQVQVARLWIKNDPAAALKWIDGLSLPEEIKQTLKTQQP